MGSRSCSQSRAQARSETQFPLTQCSFSSSIKLPSCEIKEEENSLKRKSIYLVHLPLNRGKISLICCIKLFPPGRMLGTLSPCPLIAGWTPSHCINNNKKNPFIFLPFPVPNPIWFLLLFFVCSGCCFKTETKEVENTSLHWSKIGKVRVRSGCKICKFNSWHQNLS